jgi:hypothetical protein
MYYDRNSVAILAAALCGHRGKTAASDYVEAYIEIEKEFENKLNIGATFSTGGSFQTRVR